MNCINSTYKLKKWKQEVCCEHNNFDSSCKREYCIHCIPPFKLYCFPSILRNAELRNKWIRFLKRHNKDKTQWKPFQSDRICSIHFVGCAYEENSVPTLNLGYEVEEKKARRAFIRQPLSKKVQLKKIMMSMMKMMLLPGLYLLLLLNHSLLSHAVLLITGQLPLQHHLTTDLLTSHHIQIQLTKLKHLKFKIIF